MKPLASTRLARMAAFAALPALVCLASAAGASPVAPADPAPRCSALAALKNPDRHAGVAIVLVPVAVKRDADGNVTGIDHEIARSGSEAAGSRLTADADYFIFKAEVTGSAKSAHVAVLELPTATDKPSVLWPSRDAPPRTDILPADGRWHPLMMPGPGGEDQPAIFRAEKPYGKEIYKAFATEEATDFASLLSGDDTRAPLTPIGMLVKNAMNGIASAVTSAVPKPGAAQDAVVVQVVPGH